jgi:hypothetical protein
MLAEAFQFLTTPCSPVSRRFSYLKQAIALEARYRRCRDAWSLHLDKSQALIRAAIEQCSQHREVVVLGSGLLLDVPIDDLSARFDHVVLVDMVHLRGVRRRLKAFDNVELVEIDVTGVARPLSDLIDPQSQRPWPEPNFDMCLFEGADLVVSANILSQLPLLPSDHLKCMGCTDDEAIHRYKRAIVDHHLRLLDQLTCTVCFMADVERRTISNAAPHEAEDLLLGAQPLIETNSWMWNIAPAPEVNWQTHVHHRVVGGILSPSVAPNAT